MLKVKEFERFAFSAWSPPTVDPVYLATVTAAYESPMSDEPTYPSPPLLEMFCPNLSSSDLDMRPKIGIEVDSKATSICWTSSRARSPLGVLIAGDANGGLTMYDPDALAGAIELIDDNTESDCTHLVTDPDVIERVKCSTRKSVHTGVVRSIDSNRFQLNLFASVADEGEIFIWDIEKMDQPMIPSTRTQPLETISTVAWNPRVQHILATTSAGSCVIWDLRKSESVVHLTKAMCQFEPHLMAWSPDTATRLCLADPAHPTADIQLWDLRYPKHMLSLLGRWPPPPPPSSEIQWNASSLGNAGNVNALTWSPAPQSAKSHPALMLHDPDLIAVSLTASGALPTTGGGCGSGLEPTSADFLVVWSVKEALKCVQAEAASGYPNATRHPVFVGRLEGGGDEQSVAATSGGIPSTSAVHWLPANPGLLCVSQADGWIGIYSLDAGAPGDATVPTRLIHNRSGHTIRTRLASNKVAEAFAELEIDLHDKTTKDGDMIETVPGWQQSVEDQSNTTGELSAQNLQSCYQLPQSWYFMIESGHLDWDPCSPVQKTDVVFVNQ
ncbi:unnamed protein product, partial [Echinostoma caproni]|uniref:WD_REPEATS_REGION domain-containing protein n=1 Tax=Echinostoma caproni TaxID=27848 RepID=A0A183ALC9_9TREM